MYPGQIALQKRTSPFARLAAMVIVSLSLSLPWATATGQEPTGARQRLEDLAQFRREFFERDKAYKPEIRQLAEGWLSELEKSTASIDDVAFALALARVAALADNGHSFSAAAPRSRRLERVDLRLVPFGEEFYVLRVKTPNEDLLGARLTGIDGVPIEKLRKLARSLAGGTPAWRDRNAPLFFESPPQLRALGVGKAGAPVVYEFQTKEGRKLERSFTVSPGGADRVGGNATRWMFPVLAPLEDRAWRTLLAEDKAPWALQEPVKRFRMRHDPSLNAVVLDMRQTNNAGQEKLSDFFADAEALIAKHQPRHVVLDLRLNGGGDLTTARDFAEKLPTLVPGRIFALTSPWTFSAAISTLGYLKQSAPKRVTIVGEAVGDRLEFFAEGKVITLAHSKEAFLYATERHDYVNGCRTFTDCHGNVVRRPIAVASLAPDIAAPWTIEAYQSGVDPALRAIAKALESAQD